MTVFEVKLEHEMKESDMDKIAKQLAASTGTTTVTVLQYYGAQLWWSHAASLLETIANMESIVHLKFDNIGGGVMRHKNDFRITPDLKVFTSLLENMGPRVKSVELGGIVTVEEGFPCCEGPMGLDDFEEAIQGLKNCERLDLTNFQIIYIGNAAFGYFDYPLPLRIPESILSTILKLPKLTPENAAKISRDIEDAKRHSLEEDESNSDDDGSDDDFDRDDNDYDDFDYDDETSTEDENE